MRAPDEGRLPTPEPDTAVPRKDPRQRQLLRLTAGKFDAVCVKFLRHDGVHAFFCFNDTLPKPPILQRLRDLRLFRIRLAIRLHQHVFGDRNGVRPGDRGARRFCCGFLLYCKEEKLADTEQCCGASAAPIPAGRSACGMFRKKRPNCAVKVPRPSAPAGTTNANALPGESSGFKTGKIA